MGNSIFICGGGTGGHIYPAIAIANEFKKRNPSLNIHFVGTRYGLENKIVPSKGFPFHTIPIGRLNSNANLSERVLTIFKLPFAFLKSVFLLIKHKPKLILGVGGFASGPVLFVGSIMNFKTVIWEPNAVIGMANRILSNFVDLTLAVFPNALESVKTKRKLKVGFPLRQEFLEKVSSKVKSESSEINSTVESQIDGKLKLLVFGGSQGSQFINNLISDLVISYPEILVDFNIIHQTGENNFKEISNKYKDNHIKIDVRPYLPDIFNEYLWADIILCRAGIGTISELAELKKVCILIPLPSAADDHQTKNAIELVNASAGLMLNQNSISKEKLCEELMTLKKSSDMRIELAKNISKFTSGNSAIEIVKILENEIGDMK